MQQDQTQVLSLPAAYSFAEEKGLAKQAAEIKYVATDGFGPPYRAQGARRGYMLKLLEDHDLLNEFTRRYWENGNTSDGARRRRRYRQWREEHERWQAGKGPLSDADGDQDSDEETGGEQGFALEKDLRDFLANNLTIIEPGLHLYDLGGQTGVEYPIDNGYIDILAIDRDGGLVVIELKLSRGRNRAIGQLSYYMGWVDQHLSEGSLCRGMIIAREITEDLLTATRRVPGVSLYRYRISMAIEPVTE